MDGFSQYCESLGMDGFSDPFPYSGMYAENSSLSDAGTGTTRSCTDEDIMLASSHPKKRTGRKKFKETRHPVYRGVRRRNSNRWVCEVREPNKRNRIWLGTYPTAKMAARAHDVAALALRGLKSCLNFADSAWRLPKPASTDPEDIQRAAAEAAEMFSPEENAENERMISTSCMEAASNGQQLKFYYMDEEAVFDMPGLLNDMAEGLLLPAPSFLDGVSTWDDNAEIDAHMMLWNHSI